MSRCLSYTTVRIKRKKEMTEKYEHRNKIIQKAVKFIQINQYKKNDH